MACFNINGMTLRQYCLKNNISYSCVYYRLEQGYSVEGSIERATNKYFHKNAIWMVKDESLHLFCKKKNISYSRFVRLVKKGVGVKKALRMIKENKIEKGRPPKYFCGGKSLLAFCKDEKIKYGKVVYL